MFRIGLLSIVLVLSAACGVNSVSKAEIESIKPGSKITYRYFNDGKGWYYTDKVTRIEDGVVYFNPSVNESSSGKDTRLDQFDTSRELSITMEDLQKHGGVRPPDAKTIIRIE